MSGGTTFEGEIRVASRIVDYLSSGLYETPAACLKELINNSYDADAEVVSVFVKPDANRIIIEDDGVGMSRSEFETHFQRIAESHKREIDEFTKTYRRPKIGKIGIGFIAANEICDVLEIHSTKEGSEELLIVEIDFSTMRQDPEERRREETDFAKADYRGSTEAAPIEAHFTRLFLRGVRKEARRIFSGADRKSGPSTALSLYGLHPSSVHKILSGDLKSWDQFDAYSETLLRVALNVPVRYHDNITPSKRWNASLIPFATSVEALDFTVLYDGSDVRKPVVFTAQAQRSFVHPFSIEGEHVKATGYFYAQSGVLKPQDLNGVLIRIRNAAVGEYDSSFLDYPAERGTLFQRWISCELWASDDLEDALNIDRRTLRQTHDAVVELRTLFHHELTSVISRTRRELHGQSSAERKMSQGIRQVEELERLTSDPGPTGATAAHRILEQAYADPDSALNLANRYTAAEIYETVAEVAAELIPDKRLRNRLLARLIERFLGL
jgi:hypothetical protein